MKDEWRTDKPPDEEEKYLVQLDNDEFIIMKWTQDSWITGRKSDYWHWYNVPNYTNVVAWRPLPSRYIKGRNNSGKWEFVGENSFACSECGELFTTYQFKIMMNSKDDLPLPRFCPYCGAYMENMR